MIMSTSPLTRIMIAMQNYFLIHSTIFIEFIVTPLHKILSLKQMYTTTNVIIISGDYRLRTTI